nr:ABC transporter transmembrane domain-containing protein [uncultured Gellertiella sp.]
MLFAPFTPRPSPRLPKALFRFIWQVSHVHQLGIAGLSILLFVLETAPLELQRRIVNIVSEGGAFHRVVVLALIYAAVGLSEGLVKLFLNLYRNWVSETAISWLRIHIFDVVKRLDGKPSEALGEGIQLSVIVAEAEPIGGFVGDSISQPLLQIGILLAVTGYLLYLQPLMALIIAFVFIPQIVFVKLMQAAINRRVAARTGVMRAISEALVAEGGARDRDGGQHGRIHAIFAINMSMYKIKFSMNFLMNGMVLLGNAAILAAGACFVLSGKTEVGTIVAFISGLAKINDPWGDLIDWYRSLKVTEIKYDLVRRVTETPED